MTSHADIASDVLATLLHHQLIGPREASRAMPHVGVTKLQVQAAIARRRHAGWADLQLEQNPTTAAAPTPAAPARPDPQPRTRRTEPADRPAGRAPTNRRPTRSNPNGTTDLWCTGGDHPDDEAHWAPEHQFLIRADRPHLRVSKCDRHRLSYLKARRVTIAARQALGEAGLRIRLDDDSNLVGLECKDCGQPFIAGDRIEGDAVLRHETCPTAEEPPTCP